MLYSCHQWESNLQPLNAQFMSVHITDAQSLCSASSSGSLCQLESTQPRRAPLN